MPPPRVCQVQFQKDPLEFTSPMPCLKGIFVMENIIGIVIGYYIFHLVVDELLDICRYFFDIYRLLLFEMNSYLQTTSNLYKWVFWKRSVNIRNIYKSSSATMWKIQYPIKKPIIFSITNAPFDMAWGVYKRGNSEIRIQNLEPPGYKNQTKLFSQSPTGYTKTDGKGSSENFSL